MSIPDHLFKVKSMKIVMDVLFDEFLRVSVWIAFGINGAIAKESKCTEWIVLKFGSDTGNDSARLKFSRSWLKARGHIVRKSDDFADMRGICCHE